MNRKKTIFVAVLASMMIFAIMGCNKTEEAVPPAEQTTPPAAEQPVPNPGGNMPAPSEGGAPGERPPVPAMDLAAAAAKLGISEQQLSEALGDIQQGPPDLAAAAAEVGVSEDSLREALGIPAGAPPAGGPPVGGPPPGGLPPAIPAPAAQGQ